MGGLLCKAKHNYEFTESMMSLPRKLLVAWEAIHYF